MSRISWPDRRKTICETFMEAYFGHVMLNKGIWQELERNLETYFASIEHGKHRAVSTNGESYNDAFKTLLENLKFIIQKHELNRFPVSSLHKRNVIEWISNNFQKACIDDEQAFQIHISNEISSIIEEDKKDDNDKAVDPEYIFKTFIRRSQNSDLIDWYYVTLLEENRNIIGHGTTGLTSWQGALFLADWCETREEKLKVGKVFNLSST